MGREKKKTSFPGVRYREHETRRHGVQYDKYFFVRYKLQGKDKEEGLGWASEGWTATKAAERLAELRQAQRTGAGPQTMAEKRTLADQERKARAVVDMTLAEYWEKTYYPAARVTKRLSAEKEEGHYRLWIGPLLGKLPMRSIRLPQWDELVKALDAAGRSPRTKEYVTGTLRRILKHAYDRRVIDDPPPSGKRVGVTAPKDNRRLRIIRPHEQEDILSALETSDVHAWRVTKFTFMTGCRAGEALSLEWKDVDLSRMAVTFPKTKNRDARTLPLGDDLYALLADIPHRGPTERVFTNSLGKPYPEAPSAFRTTVEALGLNEGREPRDRITFHSIRHSVATALARRLNLRDLMEVMGWRTVQMAMRYVHGDEDAKRAALAGLNKERPGKVLPFQRAGGE